MRGETVAAAVAVPAVVTMADYLRRGANVASAPAREYAPPVRAGEGAEELATTEPGVIW